MNKRDALLALAALSAMPRSAMGQERAVRIGVLVGRRNSIFLPGILKRLGELVMSRAGILIVDLAQRTGSCSERFLALARNYRLKV